MTEQAVADAAFFAQHARFPGLEDQDLTAGRWRIRDWRPAGGTAEQLVQDAGAAPPTRSDSKRLGWSRRSAQLSDGSSWYYQTCTPGLLHLRIRRPGRHPRASCHSPFRARRAWLPGAVGAFGVSSQADVDFDQKAGWSSTFPTRARVAVIDGKQDPVARRDAAPGSARTRAARARTEQPFILIDPATHH
ncbi:uncharacterized protein BBA_07679 [Beauveria bassiana ARSEF 2860]|uniref:Uncharacterized protein n=1 Tax=Beauveria bassiana (strain ARSEF 2860) TaxID=655819 RepID=J4VY84_BEAB2|nr:uncharacterized protein BBA_07679 [Beauveria bassiana ARSEF 2860]EJP63285.1 hypothetical protein BBA_07679 [Beauveria bassiana ARSEF 2860]